jgi:RND family efflux transporter MFP subunit
VDGWGVHRVIIAVFCAVAMAPAAACGEGTAVEGLTEPYRTIDVAAPEPGVITKIAVREGSTVQQGQILASLDNEVHLANLAVAQKNMESIGPLNSAIAELSLRKDRFEKLQALRAQEHARQEEVDRARAELSMAEAKLLSVQEDLTVKKLEYEKIKAQVERRIIRAPANGIVIKLFKDEGEYAAPNDPTLFTIVQIDRLIAVFSIPSVAAHDLKIDQTVEITFDSAPTKRGTIEYVCPITDAESGTARIKVAIDNSEAVYRSGERCTLALPKEKRTAKR